MIFDQQVGVNQARYLCSFLSNNGTAKYIENEIYRNYGYFLRACHDSHSEILEAFAETCGCLVTSMTGFTLDFTPPPENYKPLPRWQVDLVRGCKGTMKVWPQGNCVSSHPVSQNETEMEDLCSTFRRYQEEKPDWNSNFKWVDAPNALGVCKDDPIGYRDSLISGCGCFEPEMVGKIRAWNWPTTDQRLDTPGIITAVSKYLNEDAVNFPKNYIHGYFLQRCSSKQAYVVQPTYWPVTNCLASMVNSNHKAMMNRTHHERELFGVQLCHNVLAHGSRSQAVMRSPHRGGYYEIYKYYNNLLEACGSHDDILRASASSCACSIQELYLDRNSWKDRLVYFPPPPPWYRPGDYDYTIVQDCDNKTGLLQDFWPIFSTSIMSDLTAIQDDPWLRRKIMLDVCLAETSPGDLKEHLIDIDPAYGTVEHQLNIMTGMTFPRGMAHNKNFTLDMDSYPDYFAQLSTGCGCIDKKFIGKRLERASASLKEHQRVLGDIFLNTEGITVQHEAKILSRPPRDSIIKQTWRSGNCNDTEKQAMSPFPPDNCIRLDLTDEGRYAGYSLCTAACNGTQLTDPLFHKAYAQCSSNIWNLGTALIDGCGCANFREGGECKLNIPEGVPSPTPTMARTTVSSEPTPDLPSNYTYQISCPKPDVGFSGQRFLESNCVESWITSPTGGILVDRAYQLCQNYCYGVQIMDNRYAEPLAACGGNTTGFHNLMSSTCLCSNGMEDRCPISVTPAKRDTPRMLTVSKCPNASNGTWPNIENCLYSLFGKQENDPHATILCQQQCNHSGGTTVAWPSNMLPLYKEAIELCKSDNAIAVALNNGCGCIEPELVDRCSIQPTPPKGYEPLRAGPYANDIHSVMTTVRIATENKASCTTKNNQPKCTHPPGPTQDGRFSPFCNTWHLVQKQTDCEELIASIDGTSVYVTEIQRWNEAADHYDCETLRVGRWLCVGVLKGQENISYHDTDALSPKNKSTSLTLTPTNYYTLDDYAEISLDPTPTQEGIYYNSMTSSPTRYATAHKFALVDPNSISTTKNTNAMLNSLQGNEGISRSGESAAARTSAAGIAPSGIAPPLSGISFVNPPQEQSEEPRTVITEFQSETITIHTSI